MSQKSRYAIVMEFDSERLSQKYGNPKAFHNAYRRVKALLGYKGFKLVNKLFVGREGGTKEDCLQAVMYLRSKLPWLTDTLNYIYCVRIADTFEMLPTLKRLQE